MARGGAPGVSQPQQGETTLIIATTTALEGHVTASGTAVARE